VTLAAVRPRILRAARGPLSSRIGHASHRCVVSDLENKKRLTEGGATDEKALPQAGEAVDRLGSPIGRESASDH
jgi:hypothetical protein